MYVTRMISGNSRIPLELVNPKVPLGHQKLHRQSAVWDGSPLTPQLA